MAVANKNVEALPTSFLNEHDVARITGMSLASVRRWRLLGKGPRYRKFHAACRYSLEDVAAWIESRPTGGEQQAGGRQ